MIECICADCKKVFMLPVVLGLTECPFCGSEHTHVAVTEAESDPRE